MCSFIPPPGRKHGVTELGAEVVNYVSHAAQQRLQDLLEKVSQVAQQKNINFKVCFKTLKTCKRILLNGWAQMAFKTLTLNLSGKKYLSIVFSKTKIK